MIFRVDRGSSVAIFQQLADQVREAVAARSLQPGDRLPTVRGLAQELGLNSNTVAKAFRELEQQGVIRTRAGAGSFVEDGASLLSHDQRQRSTRKALQTAVVLASNLQISPETLRLQLEELLERYQEPGRPPGSGVAW